MIRSDRIAALGAIVLALSLTGFAIYDLILFPAAGFPTTDFSVIVAGAPTLRIGHWLKFGYALSVALLIVGLAPRLDGAAPATAGFARIAGICAVALFVASGHLGLRILAVAEATFATDRGQAVATIYLRSVTIALLDAATFAVGWYALLISLIGLRSGRLPRALSLTGMTLGALFVGDTLLPDTLRIVAPLATIGWALWLAARLFQESQAPIRSTFNPESAARSS